VDSLWWQSTLSAAQKLLTTEGQPSKPAEMLLFGVLQKEGQGQREEKSEKIAMTSPVTAEMGDDRYKVSDFQGALLWAVFRACTRPAS